MICAANQLTGFYMMGTFIDKGLSQHKFQSIQQRLEKTPALYPINCVEIKTHSVAHGLSSLNWENATLGQIPNRVFVAMTENTACTVSYNKNPFLFKHNYATYAASYVNGKSIPANPITLNFHNSDFLDGYRSTSTTTEKIAMKELRLQEMNIKMDSVCLVSI